MNVSYENNFEDVVALTEHQLSNSAVYQKRRRWSLYGSPILLLAAFSFLAYTIHKPVLFFGGVIGAMAQQA
jgi:hypothetical protein